MSTKSKNKGREQARNYVLILLPIALVVFGWWNVVNTAKSLEDNTIKTFQDAQYTVVESSGLAVQQYISENLVLNPGLFEVNVVDKASLTEVEADVQRIYISQINIGVERVVTDENGDPVLDEDGNEVTRALGDAWIYSPNYVVYDKSPDFPAIYIGKSMSEIFAIQKENGAEHYSDMAEAVEAGEGGKGWYIWEPDKAEDATMWFEPLTNDSGREIAAWAPIVVPQQDGTELTWVIGLTSMLPELMQENGAYDQIQTNVLQMTVVTIVVAVLFWFLFRAQAQVQELRQQVQELRVEIDQSKRAEQVSEIVESEYFQDLAKRARELRARNE